MGGLLKEGPPMSFLYIVGPAIVLALAIYWRHRYYTALEDRAWALQTKAKAEATADQLKVLLARSTGPCIYCQLPADQWAKCPSGFPGCGRMDDATAYWIPERITASPEWVRRVEAAVGLGPGGWDNVDPIELIQAVLDIARLRQTLQGEVLASLVAWAERPGATEEELERVLEAAVKADMGYNTQKRLEAVRLYKRAKAVDTEGEELW